MTTTDKRIPILLQSVVTVSKAMKAIRGSEDDEGGSWRGVNALGDGWLLLANPYYGFLVADVDEKSYPPFAQPVGKEKDKATIMEWSLVFSRLFPSGPRRGMDVMEGIKGLTEVKYLHTFALSRNRAVRGYQVADIIAGVALASKGCDALSALFVDEALKALQKALGHGTDVAVVFARLSDAGLVMIGRPTLMAVAATYLPFWGGLDSCGGADDE